MFSIASTFEERGFHHDVIVVITLASWWSYHRRTFWSSSITRKQLATNYYNLKLRGYFHVPACNRFAHMKSWIHYPSVYHKELHSLRLALGDMYMMMNELDKLATLLIERPYAYVSTVKYQSHQHLYQNYTLESIWQETTSNLICECTWIRSRTGTGGVNEVKRMNIERLCKWSYQKCHRHKTAPCCLVLVNQLSCACESTAIWNCSARSGPKRLLNLCYRVRESDAPIDTMTKRLMKAAKREKERMLLW